MTFLVVTDIHGAPSPEICLTAELGKTIRADPIRTGLTMSHKAMT